MTRVKVYPHVHTSNKVSGQKERSKPHERGERPVMVGPTPRGSRGTRANVATTPSTKDTRVHAASPPGAKGAKVRIAEHVVGNVQVRRQPELMVQKGQLCTWPRCNKVHVSMLTSFIV